MSYRQANIWLTELVDFRMASGAVNRLAAQHIADEQRNRSSNRRCWRELAAASSSFEEARAARLFRSDESRARLWQRQR